MVIKYQDLTNLCQFQHREPATPSQHPTAQASGARLAYLDLILLQRSEEELVLACESYGMVAVQLFVSLTGLQITQEFVKETAVKNVLQVKRLTLRLIVGSPWRIPSASVSKAH